METYLSNKSRVGNLDKMHGTRKTSDVWMNSELWVKPITPQLIQGNGLGSIMSGRASVIARVCLTSAVVQTTIQPCMFCSVRVELLHNETRKARRDIIDSVARGNRYGSLLVRYGLRAHRVGQRASRGGRRLTGSESNYGQEERCDAWVYGIIETRRMVVCDTSV